MGYRIHTADAKHTGVFIADDDEAVLLDDSGNQERWVIKGTTQEIAELGARVVTDAVYLLRGNKAAEAEVKVNEVTGTLVDVEILGGVLRVWEPDRDEGDLGRMYVLDVLGLNIVVRERADGTYVHVETNNIPRTPLLVEVNNGGENAYGEEDARSMREPERHTTAQP